MKTPANPLSLELIEGYLSDEAVKIEGFDDCICGVVERYGMGPLLLYDDFNILGAWMGEGTPCFYSGPGPGDSTRQRKDDTETT